MNLNENPTISIIMGVYNCETTLVESIDSILNQTFTDWEFIICDDGSTDNTLSIVELYAKKDERIKVLKNETNKGLTYTLNKCLNSSTGHYIARQDGDDISTSDRFLKQLNFLEKNNLKINFVSSSIRFFEGDRYWGKTNPVNFPEKKDFILQSPFAHAAVLIEKKALEFVGGYKDVYWTRRVEDYNLWFRLYAEGYKGANLNEPLYNVRDDANAFRRRKFRYRINEAIVRLNGYTILKLPKINYIYALRPILTAIVPHKIYVKIRRNLYN